MSIVIINIKILAMKKACEGREVQSVVIMGICCVKQQLTEEDIKFLKKHTRYDEETIRTVD